ncbi:hypothetical protein GFH30_12665 [Acinetobacter wanghuae]|uniref:HNH nuclease domain-containing protein n=1 Tax=Acinetobacter wanghuae TaxID=2662362 RepID=A0A5Q0P4W1_9GAMM|nr:HNH endonuclease [Acinetobacter wanghuae]MQW93412.1 hypothetical protein [Acinetobacter wanghuae]QGA12159.1 hypothetical protein GFH30_12665 [Acinetobacter wanghuae]
MVNTSHLDTTSKFFEEASNFTSEAERLIKVRLLQNKFRKSLFELNPSCVVSGFNNSKFLIASHIKPWSLSNEEERIDPYNGVLLTPTFDRLFDQGFISFKLDGEILLSKELSLEDQSFFKIPQHLVIKPFLAQKEYLEFHFDEIFRS